MNTKRVTKSHTKVVVDQGTGEILKSEVMESTTVGREPDFIKMYIQDLGRLMSLNNSDNKILLFLLSTLDYSSKLKLDMYAKQEIMEALEMPLNTVNASIKNLYNAGILIRQAHSRYLMNPALFARGRWEDVKQIRMQIDYNEEGRTIKHVEVVNNHINTTLEN